ncbi:hypothetical protein MARCHEWKA_02720 [Brevundimonas phage vB_BpoS-Marchewka]|uniref:Uncharacterized protein n=1 Tax=Brevundimonas phage vB_BpoS-Marchewka TaxID=2948604 RepID=A0A9E7N5L5_9CAUD|nr:hypothetical protein MARCHEWKA_02720 [Brevundimonas phage vB_BpoS-Marchewka]
MPDPCLIYWLAPMCVCGVFIIQSAHWWSRSDYGNAVIRPMMMFPVILFFLIPALNGLMALYLVLVAYPQARAFWDSYEMVLKFGFPTGEDRRWKPEPCPAGWHPDLDD